MASIMTRENYEKVLDNFLAPYACHTTKGRRVAEKEDKWRVAFQRDRDRILFSPSFRRLEFKTQVYVYRENDYFRTRLTHTLEVMQTATELARFLKLNVDLVEAIALGHDLGHTPFGHAGERALVNCDGLLGFRHNEQSLRIVDLLENYGRFKNGLNLTWEVREGILKHTTVTHIEEYEEFYKDTNPNGTLEAQLVNISDDVVQVTHDIDDAIRAKVLSSQEIEKIWNTANLPSPYSSELAEYKYTSYASWLLGPLMNDLVNGTFECIQNLTFEDVLRSKDMFVKFSALTLFFASLKKKLNDIHQSHTIALMDFKGQRIIVELFKAFKENIMLLPSEARQRISLDTQERIICDYIASMTDRTAHEMYDKLFLPYRE